MFETPELDYVKTKKKVLKMIDKYEKSLMRLNSSAHPKVTQTFTMDMPSFGGGFNSSTENTAIYAMEGCEPDLDYIKNTVDCVNRLTLIYREIIWLSFFEKLPNEEVADLLKISVSLLTIRKRTAIELFAYALGIEVYKKL
ncbi:ArpU family phage packaging/lysis transcriptional regulator [Jeotgalibaca porci]|uniref:ArpU family phage packaging/lysis transcriptional regulator n=1 Tax=Jeotgalibaca porci TaxID=1868793 RepID=UPI0035A19579